MRQHRCKRFRVLVSMSFQGQCVCLSVTFVHYAPSAEDIDTISFAYDSPMSHPDRVKIWLTINLFLAKFCPKMTP